MYVEAIQPTIRKETTRIHAFNRLVYKRYRRRANEVFLSRVLLPTIHHHNHARYETRIGVLNARS